jgi:hypothetical protein
MLAGQVNMGGVVSRTVTVWLQSAVLPQASVARQVRVAVNVLPQVKFVIVPTKLVLTVPQVSVAVGRSKVQAVPHSTVLFAAQMITGGAVSRTVTVWLQGADWLPQASVARQVRVAEKVLPQVKLVTVLTTMMVLVPQVSVAVGGSKVQAVPHSTVLLAAQMITGGVVSRTVTVWLHWAVLPQASVARQVRVAEKVLPQVKLVTVPTTLMLLVPQVSVAVGGSKLHAVPHSTVLLAAQMITGGVVSRTVTVWLHGADWLPQASVARQVRVAV